MRVKRGNVLRKRHKKILKLAKGYRGGKSKLFRTANEAVMKSLVYAYVGRKRRKRDFRRLWITRISAACKMNGMNYSTFMHGLKLAGVTMNRKMLAETAVYDAEAFKALIETAKKAISRDFSVIPDSEGGETDAYTYSGAFKANSVKTSGLATSTDDFETIVFA